MSVETIRVQKPITGNNSTSDNNSTNNTSLGDDYTDNESDITIGDAHPSLKKECHTKVYKGYDEWWESAIIPTMHGSYSYTATPIGAKVIPESHDLYGDGTAGYASLYYIPGHYNFVTLSGGGDVIKPTGDFTDKIIYPLNTPISTIQMPALSSPNVVNIDRNTTINLTFNKSINLIPHGDTQRFTTKSAAFNKIGYSDNLINSSYTIEYIIPPFFGDYNHIFSQNSFAKNVNKYGNNIYTSAQKECANATIQNISEWHLPTIQELLYLCAQWKAYNDLTFEINTQRYKTHYGNVPARYAEFFELNNLSTFHNGVSRVYFSHQFNLLSSTPSINDYSSMYYIRVTDSGDELRFNLLSDDTNNITGIIIPFKNV
ncbi:MAG: hypothetical protein NC548_26115 [Lachnospiraceae bacterium]|nr:hypothetical protein [Lachnospiraceae bacterium]